VFGMVEFYCIFICYDLGVFVVYVLIGVWNLVPVL